MWDDNDVVSPSNPSNIPAPDCLGLDFVNKFFYTRIGNILDNGDWMGTEADVSTPPVDIYYWWLTNCYC